MFTGISILDFRRQFKTEDDCLKYLVDIKWGNGYKCVKCGHKGSITKGRQWFYRRCRLCRYDQSVTAGTLFHKCKLGLLRAFEMGFRISVRKKGMSTCELGKELGCQQKSAWLFKAKLQEAMKSSEQRQLKGNVEIDEFMVGGFEQQAPGRTPGEKSLVVLAVERVIDKKGNENLGCAYARVIDDASAESLKAIFDKHIAKRGRS
ncbi:MAG: IS1595 family transposase [Segetibacter sp.]